MVISKGRASNAIRDGIEAFECGNILSAVNYFRLLGYDIVWIILHLWIFVISHQWYLPSFPHSTIVKLLQSIEKFRLMAVKEY